MASRQVKSTFQAPLAAAKSSAARSKLSREHFAFLRGWFQGIGEKELWDLYLIQNGPFDVRRCRSFLKDVQVELGAVAQRSGQPSVAGLLRRKGALIAASNEGAPVESTANAGPTRASQRTPDLEEFSRQFDEDMYSQAELTELWREAYAGRSSGRPTLRDATKRRGALIARQIAALEWLERLACERPQTSDPVSAWLDPRVAERVALVGVRTLGELVFFIGQEGFHWHRKVPRIGVNGAAILVRWLSAQEETLGQIPITALFRKSAMSAPQRQALAPKDVLGIAPLERVRIPLSLASADPAGPGNRAPVVQCKLDAVNDFQAIQEWLGLRSEGSHTRRAYRREAERFLLWAVFERQKALSSLSSKDCVAYREFLVAPGPLWVGRRNVERWSPRWRPFEAGLSAGSAQTATTILRAMCEWLSRRRYLDSNPWDGVPKSGALPSMPTLRSLSRHQWALVEDWLRTLPEGSRTYRIRLLLEFAYRSGLRESELAAAKVEWLRHEQLEDGEWAWSMMVLGKGNKWREVALPSSAVKAIATSFEHRGLNRDLLANSARTPLIAALPRPMDPAGAPCPPLTPGRIYVIVKDAFDRCATHVAARDRKAADRIRQASTHWLRHTHGAHAAESMPLEVLQMQMGHESPATTALYARAERSRRQKEVEKAFG